MTARGLFLNAPVHRNVVDGEIIYAEGDEGSHMYGIVEGAVTLSKGTATVARLGPGDVFGERALIDHLPRSLTAVAAEPSTIAEIDRALFLFLIDATPMFALEVMGALASRLRDYDDRVGGAEPRRDP